MEKSQEFFMRDQVNNRVAVIMAHEARERALSAPSLVAFFVLLAVFNIIAFVPAA